MISVPSYLEQLERFALPTGGWGYAPGQPAQLEPTVLGLLALAQERTKYEATIARGLQVLARCAQSDGTYRLEQGRAEAVWPTSLALFAKLKLGESQATLQPTVHALLAIRGKPGEKTAEDIHDIDLALIGWPWAEGNFSWVEPTAWACLALRAAGLEKHPRVEEGLYLLLDRAFADGGINYGNRTVLGRPLEPLPNTTALFLCALQGRPFHTRVQASLQYLQEVVQEQFDLENLCWARIALALYHDVPGIPESLAVAKKKIHTAYTQRLEQTHFPVSPVRLALTALALSDADLPAFHLPTQVQIQAGPERVAPLPVRRKPLTERLASVFQGLAAKALGQLRPRPGQSAVHIGKAPSYDADLLGVLTQQYEHYRSAVSMRGKRVVLKPNLVEHHPDKVINTDPRVVKAVIELCKQEGAKEIIVAEGPGHWRNVEHTVQASGLGQVLAEQRVPFVDLNHDEPTKLPNLGRLTGMEYLYLAKTVANAEVLISLPKLKTHHWAGATLSLKNLFGTLSGLCYGWPKNELHWRGIDNSIVDIALTRTPDLAIVDGVVGMEGDGPLNGTAKQVGALVMGTDLLAVDATCCRLMQLQPEKIAYLQLGYAKRLGLLYEKEIVQLGAEIAELAQAFAVVPHFEHLRQQVEAKRVAEPELVA